MASSLNELFAFAYTHGIIRDSCPPFVSVFQLSKRDAWGLQVLATFLRKSNDSLENIDVEEVQSMISVTRKIANVPMDLFETSPFAC